jgi:hypothetical protein
MAKDHHLRNREVPHGPEEFSHSGCIISQLSSDLCLSDIIVYIAFGLLKTDTLVIGTMTINTVNYLYIVQPESELRAVSLKPGTMHPML